MILQIKSEIENFKSQGVELEEQRKAILKTLDEKQSLASQKADEFDQKHKEVSKILDQLRAGNLIYYIIALLCVCINCIQLCFCH